MTRRAPRLVAVVLLTLPVLAVRAQERPAPTTGGAFRIVRGQVVASDVGGETPLQRVRIQLTGRDVVSTPTYTDRDGGFEVAVPGTASYALVFTKAGFAPQELQGSVSSPPTNVRVRLTRGAVISGRLADQYGDPVAGRVRVRRVADEAGRRVAAPDSLVESDDLGEFRAGSLPAGRYEVGLDATPEPGAAEPRRGSRTPAVVQLGAGEQVTVALVDDVPVTDPRGTVIGASRTPVVANGATIQGHVVSVDSRPVGGAFVRLSAGFESARQTASAADGTFQFSGLPAGTYRISAAKVGASLAMADRDREVTVRQRQVIDAVTIRMAKHPAVMGTVLDENGEPVEGVAVELLQSQRAGGRRVLQRMSAVRPRRTDDRGRYRLFPVEPGDHYVAALEEVPPRGGAPGAADSAVRIYYPGRTAIGEAVTVRVVAGQDAPGIDIDYEPGAGVRLFGHAFDSLGKPLTRPVTLVERAQSGRPMMAPREARVGQDGAFSFLNVPPGDYVLQGLVRPTSDRSSELGFAFVSVAETDGLPLTLRTSLGTTVRGRVALEGNASRVRLDEFGVRALAGNLDYDAIGLDWPGAGVENDGTFAFRVQGPMHIVSSVTPAGWWLKSVRIGAADAADEPYAFAAQGDPVDVEVVFSNAMAEVSGRVQDATGRPPARETLVVLFSVDESRWHVGSPHVSGRRVLANGSFDTLATPPGDYWLVALDVAESMPDLADGDFLRSLVPRAQRVSVAERQRVARTLLLADGSRR